MQRTNLFFLPSSVTLFPSLSWHLIPLSSSSESLPLPLPHPPLLSSESLSLPPCLSGMLVRVPRGGLGEASCGRDGEAAVRRRVRDQRYRLPGVTHTHTQTTPPPRAEWEHCDCECWLCPVLQLTFSWRTPGGKTRRCVFRCPIFNVVERHFIIHKKRHHSQSNTLLNAIIRCRCDMSNTMVSVSTLVEKQFNIINTQA